jgi:hypothetical protein
MCDRAELGECSGPLHILGFLPGKFCNLCIFSLDFAFKIALIGRRTHNTSSGAAGARGNLYIRSWRKNMLGQLLGLTGRVVGG